MSDTAILIGTCGWEFDEWQTSYYPEGLPQDWQLAYYGNEYPVVLLPAAFWLQDAATIANWREELAERPAFIAEWVFSDDSEVQAAIRDGLASIAARVIGVLVRLSAMPDATQLQSLREQAVATPLILDWPAVTVEQCRELQIQLGASVAAACCWHGDPEQAEVLDTGPLLLAQVETAGQTPRSLRGLLETIIAKAGKRQAVILFDGTPPDLEVVDQAEVISNLL